GRTRGCEAATRDQKTGGGCNGQWRAGSEFKRDILRRRRVVESRSRLDCRLQHLPEVELGAKDQLARGLQERPKAVVLGAARSKRARDIEGKVREPAFPICVAGRANTVSFEATQVGGEFDSMMLNR